MLASRAMVFVAAACIGHAVATAESDREPALSTHLVDSDGAVHLPAMTVPFSVFASPQAKKVYLERQALLGALKPRAMSVTEQRRWVVEHYTPILDHARALYSVEATPSTIGGVYADVIVPKEGIAPESEHRVLINLHGGGFVVGARIMGSLESVPLASRLKIKVVAIDYRLAPEYHFPAASEDVAAVYRELLKQYSPRSIGIYGCSAGGLLAAEAVAWFAKVHLPRPGAIGIFCASADALTAGDSRFFAPPLMGEAPPERDSTEDGSTGKSPYFREADVYDPLASPLRSAQSLARFPPTLIVTSTRDPALSSAVYTHTQLVKLGVEAELHVWEGMIHGFFTTDPDLPETREAWDAVARFFDHHLSR